MGFISNQLEGALRAGTAHKELASQLFSYCRDNKDSIGSEGYWQMFTMPNADLGELAKSIKYLPKKNGNYCVELADVNFYFKTESDVFKNVHMRKQSVFLKNGIYVSHIRRKHGNILAVHINASLCGSFKAAYHTQSCRFSAARRA